MQAEKPAAEEYMAPVEGSNTEGPPKKSVLKKVRDKAKDKVKKIGSKLKKPKGHGHEEGEKQQLVDGSAGYEDEDEDMEEEEEQQHHPQASPKDLQVPLDEYALLKQKESEGNGGKGSEHKLSEGLPSQAIAEQAPQVFQDDAPPGVLQAVPTDYHYKAEPADDLKADEKPEEPKQQEGALANISEKDVQALSKSNLYTGEPHIDLDKTKNEKNATSADKITENEYVNSNELGAKPEPEAPKAEAGSAQAEPRDEAQSAEVPNEDKAVSSAEDYHVGEDLKAGQQSADSKLQDEAAANVPEVPSESRDISVGGEQAGETPKVAEDNSGDKTAATGDEQPEDKPATVESDGKSQNFLDAKPVMEEQDESQGTQKTEREAGAIFPGIKVEADAEPEAEGEQPVQSSENEQLNYNEPISKVDDSKLPLSDSLEKESPSKTEESTEESEKEPPQERDQSSTVSYLKDSITSKLGYSGAKPEGTSETEELPNKTEELPSKTEESEVLENEPPQERDKSSTVSYLKDAITSKLGYSGAKPEEGAATTSETEELPNKTEESEVLEKEPPQETTIPSKLGYSGAKPEEESAAVNGSKDSPQSESAEQPGIIGQLKGAIASKLGYSDASKEKEDDLVKAKQDKFIDDKANELLA